MSLYLHLNSLRLQAARCAFCGDTELSLCSTFVEGPTWEESVGQQLEVKNRCVFDWLPVIFIGSGVFLSAGGPFSLADVYLHWKGEVLIGWRVFARGRPHAGGNR